MEVLDWQNMSLEEAMQTAEQITDKPNFLRGLDSERRGDVQKLLFQRMDEVFTQPEIAALAMAHNEFWFSYRAVERLADRALLHEVALHAEEPQARSAALVKLGDQSLFKCFALDAKQDTSVRKEAVRNLTEADTLLWLALFENYYALRELAQRRIETLEITLEAPKEADKNGFVTVNGYVRGYFKVTELPILPETAEAIDSLWPYKGGAKAILCLVWVPDGAQPRKAAAAPKRPIPFYQKDDIAKAALAAVSDPKDYYYIIKNDPRASVRRRAVKHIVQDEALLLGLALEDTSESVRVAAAQRLQAPASVDKLLKQGTGDAKRIAAKKTSNSELLIEMALASQSKWLHCIALRQAYGWTLLEIIAMLGKARGKAKGWARLRMEGMEAQWRASGLSLLEENQRLYADAAMNDAMFYRLVIDHMTDEACIADILCSLSPHNAGATAYGPVGEARYVAGNFYDYSPEDIARAKRALSRLNTKEALQKVMEHAVTHYLRNAAKERLDELQNKQ